MSMKKRKEKFRNRKNNKNKKKMISLLLGANKKNSKDGVTKEKQKLFLIKPNLETKDLISNQKMISLLQDEKK